MDPIHPSRHLVQQQTPIGSIMDIGINVSNPSYQRNDRVVGDRWWHTVKDYVTDATPCKHLSGVDIYNSVDEDGDVIYAIYGSSDYFYKKSGPLVPTLVSVTEDGLTSDFDKFQEPVMVMLHHTPEKVRLYPARYFIDHRDDITDTAMIELFDWYWTQPFNCYKQLLEGAQIPGYVINISAAARAKILLITESPTLDINLWLPEKPEMAGKWSSIKYDIVDRWKYYGYEAKLQDHNLGAMLDPYCDGTNRFDEPLILNDIIMISFPPYDHKIIDIRLVDEMPIELDLLIAEKRRLVQTARAEPDIHGYYNSPRFQRLARIHEKIAYWTRYYT